jgi:hypothetical protein
LRSIFFGFFLFVHLLSSQSAYSIARWSSFACESKLIEQSFLSLFRPGAFEDLSRIDDTLIQHLASLGSGLSKKGLAVFAKKLSTPDFFDRADGLLCGVGISPDCHGRIKSSPFKVSLMLQQSLVNHPMGRITIAHEGAHLVHAVNRWDAPVLSIRLPLRMMFRRKGIVAEEAWAFGSEWDFIRKIYRVTDLPRLHQLYSPLLDDEIHHLLVASDIVVKHGEYLEIRANRKSRRELENSESLRMAVEKVVMAYVNEAFLETVTQALATSKEDYIATQLGNGYRDAKRSSDLRQGLGLALSSGTLFIGLGRVLGWW